MDVTREPKELLFRTHPDSFVESLEKGDRHACIFVEIHGIASEDRIGESIDRIPQTFDEQEGGNG